MPKAYKFVFPAALISLTACSTLNESIQLGASMGAVAGAAATYTAENSRGEKPSSDNVLAGAAVGLVAGIITSNIVHNKVAESRGDCGKPEMYFGDLPPNPFIFSPTQKGGQ